MIVIAVTDDRKKVHIVRNCERCATYHFPQGNGDAWAEGERNILRHRVPRSRVYLSKPVAARIRLDKQSGG